MSEAELLCGNVFEYDVFNVFTCRLEAGHSSEWHNDREGHQWFHAPLPSSQPSYF